MLDRVRGVERLTQQQMYLTERLYDILEKNRAPHEVRRNTRTGMIWRRGDTGQRIYTIEPKASNEILARLLTELRGAMGRSIELQLKSGSVLQGKLLGIENELPDTTLIVEPDIKQAESASILSIKRAVFFPPADDDEPPF